MLEDYWLETEKNMYLTILISLSFALYISTMVALNVIRSKFAWYVINHPQWMPYLNKLGDGRLFETVVHNSAARHIITNNGCTVWEQLLDLPTTMVAPSWNNYIFPFPAFSYLLLDQLDLTTTMVALMQRSRFHPSLAFSRLLETIWQDLSTYSNPLCSMSTSVFWHLKQYLHFQFNLWSQEVPEEI